MSNHRVRVEVQRVGSEVVASVQAEPGGLRIKGPANEVADALVTVEHPAMPEIVEAWNDATRFVARQ